MTNSTEALTAMCRLLTCGNLLALEGKAWKRTLGLEWYAFALETLDQLEKAGAWPEVRR